MKTLNLILAMLLFFPLCITAQEDVQKSYVSFPIGKNNQNLAYSIIIETMTSTGINIEKGVDGKMLFNSSKLNESVVVINNLVINQSMLIGIGGGFDIRLLHHIGGSVFFNFRQYYGTADKKFRPMFNGSFGLLLAKRAELLDENQDSYRAPFVSAGGGFRAGHFSFHGGLRYTAHKIVSPSSSYSHIVDAYIQFGIIF